MGLHSIKALESWADEKIQDSGKTTKNGKYPGRYPEKTMIQKDICKLVQPLWRTVWRFLKKLEIELPYDPAIPLLGIHTEETRRERDTCTPMFITALFIIARTWKQPRCPCIPVADLF